MAQFDLEFK